jgi:hypothetical protein
MGKYEIGNTAEQFINVGPKNTIVQFPLQTISALCILQRDSSFARVECFAY